MKIHFKFSKVGIAVVAVSLVFVAGYAQGQNRIQVEIGAFKQLEDELIAADTDPKLNSDPMKRDEVLRRLRESLDGSASLNIVERHLLRLQNDEANKRLQIIQIEQNAQIIRLLKKISGEPELIQAHIVDYIDEAKPGSGLLGGDRLEVGFVGLA